MKVVHISDTHNNNKNVPECELLIHSGDMTNSGTIQEVMEGLLWLQAQKASIKIFVPGNHDMCLDQFHMYGLSPASIEALVETQKREHNIHILLHPLDAIVQFKPFGWDRVLKIGGTPVQPWFGGWGFNVGYEADRHEIIDPIAAQCDILITHAPPQYVLDIPRAGEHVGDPAITKSLAVRRNVKYLFCGHIHESAGHAMCFETKVYNSATKVTELEIHESEFT